MISLPRLFKSFTYALRGLSKVAKEEQNFKIELLIAVIVAVMAYWSGFSYLEWAVLVLVMGVVFIMEVINSAVELISDILKPKIDHYVKDIKDMVSTAVMLASLTAVMVGLILFAHHWL